MAIEMGPATSGRTQYNAHGGVKTSTELIKHPNPTPMRARRSFPGGKPGKIVAGSAVVLGGASAHLSARRKRS
jgi:hypothetical protein